MKYRFLVPIVVIAVVIIGILVSRRSDGANLLGNMNRKISEKTTSSSSFSFKGQKGDKIKISFRSEIDTGDLDCKLCDSKGNVVYQLSYAKALETFYTLEKDDTYELVASNKDFTGKFSVKISRAK